MQPPSVNTPVAPYFANYVKQQLIAEYGAGQGVRRRLPRHDVDRPRAAEGGEARDREVAPRSRRAGCRARRDRSTRRQRRRDGRGKELPREPVQPRRAGAAPAGLGLQAVRPRGRAAAGNRAGLDVRLEADLDLARRPDVARVQLRPRLSRGDQPRRRHHALGQHRLRAADRDRRPEGGELDRTLARRSQQAQPVLRDRARRRGGQPARARARVRGVPDRGSPPRRVDLRQRSPRGHPRRAARRRRSRSRTRCDPSRCCARRRRRP